MTKSEIRKNFQEQRSAMSALDVKLASQLINQNFLFNLFPQLYSNKAIFALYLAANNEVETEITAKFFKKNNIKFSYPKIISNSVPLEFIAYSENQKFIPNNIYKNILEPENGEKIIPNILIIPLVAFDDKLYRIGMGGGFFDRTIADFKNNSRKITTIGFAYNNQRFKGSIPIENTDLSLDFIVSETNVLRPKAMFSKPDTIKKFTDFVNK